MLGDGRKVDLYKLLNVVKGKGGYEAVCNGELWDLVGEECGLGVNVGSSLKQVYSKYKSVLDACMKKVSDGKVSDECGLMELEAEVKGLLSNQIENVVAGEEVKGGVDGGNEVKNLNLESTEEKEVKGHNGGSRGLEVTNPGMIDESDVGKFCEGNDGMEVVEEVDGGKISIEPTVDASDVVKSGESSGLLNVVGENRDDGTGGNSVSVLDSSSGDGGSSGFKRKRESLFDLLSWVTDAAKNPCDPAIGYMPDKSKWKSNSSQEAWKRVLLFRVAVFHKKESSIEQHNWQSQKMHPSMYDDPIQTTYNLRERLKRGKKLLYGTHSPTSRSSSNSSIGAEGDLDRTPSPRTNDRAENQLLDAPRAPSGSVRYPLRHTRAGRCYQAALPEWTGMTSESDPKWFGTQVWPSEMGKSRFLIERDPIGKGREDSCGCSVPGSVECVRFHISEKKAKVKLELGVAFYKWNLDKVGEDVRHSWTDEEEKNFREVIQANPPSSERYFWDHIFQAFPMKSRAALVSYYFNVYLLQLRAYQNRYTPDKIDSDDEESECAIRDVFGHQTQSSRGSILLTRSKSQSKRKQPK